jgi:RNA polymerase primary sigma factor
MLTVMSFTLEPATDEITQVNRKIDFVPSHEFDSTEESKMAEAAFDLYVNEEEEVSSLAPELFLFSVEQLRYLSAEGERFLFKRLNFLRFRANAIQATLTNSKRSKTTEAEIHRLLSEAEETRSKIAYANLRLLHSIVRRFASSRDEIDELASEANTILLNAIDKFNYSRGFRFSTYVTHAIQRHLLRVKRRGYRERDRTRALSSLEHVEAAGLDSEIAEERLIAAVKKIVESFDDILEPREKHIVMGRFGLDGTSKGKSMRVLGDELELSKERVRQILQSSLEKLATVAKPLDFDF